MKFAIISDTHDNLPNIKKIVNWLNKEKINLLLHCGDVCTRSTIEEGFRDFKGDINISLGNADANHDLEAGKIGNVNIVSEFGEINIDKKKIAFVHFPKEAEDLAKKNKYDLVFHGHTHKPCLARRSFGEGGGKKECLIVNPGESAGVYNKATFATYDTGTDKLELIVIERMSS